MKKEKGTRTELVSDIPYVLTVNDDKIYVSFRSPGISGAEWFEKLKSHGIEIEPDVESILKSKGFVPTKNDYKLVIIVGSKFQYGNRTISFVREHAYRRGLFKVTLEAACILRYLFSDDDLKEMFLHSLVAVSTHAKKEFTNVLGFDVDDKPNSLKTYCVKEILRWRRSTGFVFSEHKIIKHRNEKSK